MQKFVGRIRAKAENGKEIDIFQYRDVIPVGHMGDPNAVMMGKLVTLRTSEGHLVSPLEDGRFLIVELGVIATRMEN